MLAIAAGEHDEDAVAEWLAQQVPSLRSADE